MFRNVWAIATGLFTAMLCSQAFANTAAESITWLAGHWCMESEGMKTEELWLPPKAGTLIGISRTLKGERMVAFEFLLIAPVDGVVSYLAQPGGRPPTTFKRTAGGENWIRLENLQHDFPQRIEYHRRGAALHAQIAGPGEDGKEKVIPFVYGACANN